MADSGLYEFSLALSRVLDRVGEGLPINLSVSVSDANEVTALKARVAELEKENDALLVRTNRAEFSHRCDAIICMRVVDWCREQGIRIPRELYKGLNSFGE